MKLDSLLNRSNIPNNVQNYLREHMPSETVLKEIIDAFNKSVLFDNNEKYEHNEKEINDLKRKIDEKLKWKFQDHFEEDMLKLSNKWKLECGRNHITVRNWNYSLIVSFSTKLTNPGRFVIIDKIVYDFRRSWQDNIVSQEQINLLKKFDSLLEEAWYKL